MDDVKVETMQAVWVEQFLSVQWVIFQTKGQIVLFMYVRGYNAL